MSAAPNRRSPLSRALEIIERHLAEFESKVLPGAAPDDPVWLAYVYKVDVSRKLRDRPLNEGTVPVRLTLGELHERMGVGPAPTERPAPGEDKSGGAPPSGAPGGRPTLRPTDRA